jgi:predicted O-linked N-acetylglucosamine transferase (SPINDLY family)
VTNGTTARELLDAAREALRTGDSDRAAALLLPLLASHANDANALQEAGVILATAQLHEVALQFFERSLAINPSFARGQFNLGLTLRSLGQTDHAERAFRTAAQLAPDAPEPLIELADLLGHSGKVEDAIALLNANASRFNQSDRFHAMHGHLLKRSGRLAEAAGAVKRAIQRSPKSIGHRCNLALLLNELGRSDEADAALAPMLASNPPASIRLRTAVMLPAIPISIEEIHRSRARLESTLDELLRSSERIVDPIAALNSVPFYLAYAGLNDRQILEKLAAVHRHLCPSLNFTAPHVQRGQERRPRRGRIRLGVISTNLFAHTIGRLNVGLIEHVDRSRFELFVLENSIDDPIANRVRAAADHVIRAPRSFAAMREQIARAELDVILYPDIGMVPLTYYLASARLAPLQCVTWGHPLTSGLSTLDCFLSARDLETDGSQAQYTEKLHCFSVPGTCYARPQFTPVDDARSRLGFALDWRLYVCPQSLFKIHPEFDTILARILREDQAARIILVAGNQGGMFEALRRRFERTMGGDVNRVILLPKLSGDEFLALLSIANANLDTIHFGGGNTSLEAFAVGCPIVTLPSEMLRGRITCALSQQMGVTECIVSNADQYVRTALRLANDQVFYEQQRQAILAQNRVLYDNRRTIREFEEFIVSALQV